VIVGSVGYNSIKKDVSMEIKQFLDEIKSKKKHTKNRIVVGVLLQEVIDFLKQKNIEVYSNEIILNLKGLSHLMRDSKRSRGAGLNDEDILQIPLILQEPYAIYLDTQKEKLNLLYCGKKNCNDLIKIVIDTKVVYKGKRGTFIKTAGYVKWYNLEKNKKYVKIK